MYVKTRMIYRGIHELDILLSLSEMRVWYSVRCRSAILSLNKAWIVSLWIKVKIRPTMNVILV